MADIVFVWPHRNSCRLFCTFIRATRVPNGNTKCVLFGWTFRPLATLPSNPKIAVGSSCSISTSSTNKSIVALKWWARMSEYWPSIYQTEQIFFERQRTLLGDDGTSFTLFCLLCVSNSKLQCVGRVTILSMKQLLNNNASLLFGERQKKKINAKPFFVNFSDIIFVVVVICLLYSSVGHFKRIPKDKIQFL